MEQIIITKPNLSTYPMASKRTATQIKSAKQTMALLGDDVVDVNVESPFPQTYGIGDKITVFGRVYKLNQLPKVKKTGMRKFSYDIQFEGVQYDLLCATYDLTIDTTTNELQDVQADSLTGDLRRFATVLIANACRVFPGKWVLGTCPDTKTITLTFSETDNCLSVLQNLCSENNFNIEFEIAQNAGVNTVNFKKVGQIFPYTFQFGRGKGLYSLDRQNVSSSSIVTRLKVYGSTDNITSKYRAQRLCLPGKTKSQSYIEKADAVAKYGIIEGKKFFDDIKPTFNGSITGLVSGSVLKFIDTKMFDLNALEADGKTTKYKMVGCAPKVHFNTGNLAGYEFEAAYDHATNTFTLVKQKDNMDYEFPSSKSPAFQFSVGNEYKLLDIALPDIPYQNDAENKLNEQGNIYYDQNSQPKVQYGLSVTKAYLKTLVGNGTTVNIFAPGDYIPVKDTDIDVDKSVRVQSLTRNLLDEYDYSLTISDTVSTNITNRVISELVDIDKIITINNLKDPVRARANWRSSREVLNMVFDPEGDYYTDKIKPNSIDTLALSVGAKSMQFGLTNTVLQPNFNGNKNTIKVKGGVLTHYTINEESARSWVLADNTTTFPKDTQAYYIYAKCAKVGTAGSIIFSTEQIKVEQDAMFYHFWIGVVNSVDAELKARSVALSYGFTMINGRFITTGRIQTIDGYTYIDLDGNQFRIGNGNCGIEYNIGNSGVVKIIGATVQIKNAAGQTMVYISGSDGSGQLAKGNITWNAEGDIKAKGGTFTDIIIQGSLRNPFVRETDSIIIGGKQPTHDNVVPIASGGGWTTSGSLEWGVEQSGRRMCIANYRWGSAITDGQVSYSAPTGQYFYEDGIMKRSIHLSRECVELMGYGTETQFYGWIVLNRINLGTNARYGRKLNVLAHGIVSGYSSGASINCKTFDDSTLTVSRFGEGQYRVYFPSSWGLTAGNYIVMMTGYGGGLMKASLLEQGNSSFAVEVSDDASRNDGSFMFQITNMNDWT